MTTECPVRIRGNTERWPVLNQSTSYRSSSAQMSIEDLGLFLNDRRFRGPEKDVIPNRSESAPPSMEGSMAAIGNIFSFQRSALAPGSMRPSMFAINLEIGQHSHANSADVFSRLPIKILPSHEEESEDDQSSDQSCSISGEKFTTLGHHNMPLNSKQEDSFHSSSLSHDHYNSFSYKSSERAVVSDENCNIFHNIPISMQSSGSITPCSGNMSQISSLDSSRDQADWPCGNEEDLNTVKVDERDNHTGEPSNVYGAHGKAVKSGSEFTASSSRSYKLHMKEQSKSGNNLLQQQAQESSPQNQSSYPQIVYSGPPNDYGGLKRFHNASSSVSATESQPVLNASGYTLPMYASTAAFMASPTAFYPGLRPSGFIAPQYGIGRYNLNSAVFPSYIAGYPHQSIVPMALDGASFLTSGVPNGANIHAYDQQNLFKFYGQVGVHMQPPYGMHYFHPMIQNAYGLYDHFDHQTSIDGATVKVMNSFSSSVRGSTPVALSNDYKSQHPAGPSYSNLNLKIGNTPSHYNFGNPTDTASLGQFPAALAKPVTGINFPGTRYTMNRSHTSDGSPNTPNEHNRTWNDLNSYSFLEDLKSGKGQRFELSDIAGHIVEFSIDQHGSRFIQQKLEICTVEEKASVLKEVVPHASKLMTDVFGNYVIQKLLEYGSPDQRKYLTSQLEGQILSLSLQMYGCRVIQKALEVVDLEQKTNLVRELDGHIMRCVRDQNGNHVIQKCIETFPTENIHFIISCFRGQVAALSMHPYGCRVVQRILEHCSNNQQTQFIVDEILDSVCSLAQDQYGNYVTQHVLVRGNPQERNEIIEKLSASIVQLSQHKFASNVIEKCIEYSNPMTRDMLIKNIFDHGDLNDNLLIMMKDQYANYVVQKILDKCSIEQRELLLGVIRNHITTLKKYTYGKHIVSRFERLSVEDNETHRITG